MFFSLLFITVFLNLLSYFSYLLLYFTTSIINSDIVYYLLYYLFLNLILNFTRTYTYTFIGHLKILSPLNTRAMNI